MLGERVTAALTDDDVIDYEDVHEAQQVLEAASDEVIRGARLKGTGWVVMGENHRSGVMMERLAEHISWMDMRAIYRSAEELLEGDEAAPIIEIEAAEDLVIEIA